MNAVVTPRGPAFGASHVGVSVLAAAAALVMAAGRLPW
jgi:hypothetical protein